ncbi:MFS general substrate transporter [Xylariaceae sp. FL1272]|nr:MFS general substrate transporter [Xylariaceae sp. FL1272]
MGDLQDDQPEDHVEKSTDGSESGSSPSEASMNTRPELLESERPINWHRTKKWTTTLMLSSFSFLQPLSETMLAPAQAFISHDLHIGEGYEWVLVNSVILVGIGISPLVLAPLSEVYGRRPILLAASIVFLIWNTACGGSKTFEQILTFRLFSGFGASVADALAGGLMNDLWSTKERGRAFAVYMAAPLLGPALGPILGAFISEYLGWRWIFWITSIASGLITIVAAFFLPETYEPRLETLHRQNLQKHRVPHLRLLPSEGFASFVELMRTNLQRPLRMLLTQPIIHILATYMALLYGTMFLFLFLYTLLWTENYHESVGIGSLNYLSFAIGLIIGVNISGHLNDYIYDRLQRRTENKKVGLPRYRIPPMTIGTLFIPTGLLLWGWTGQHKLHWILPNIGSLLFGAGVYICSGCVSVYTIDAYGKFAASALSTTLVARSLASAFFPLFGPSLFNAVAFGAGATILAGAFLAVGTVAVLVLWVFGESLRARSSYCSVIDT